MKIIIYYFITLLAATCFNAIASKKLRSFAVCSRPSAPHQRSVRSHRHKYSYLLSRLETGTISESNLIKYYYR